MEADARSEAELRAAVDAALERVDMAEREAARHVAQGEQAEAQSRSHQQARQRVETQARALQAACRQMQLGNRDAEEESKRLEEEVASRRAELQAKMESAIGDVERSAALEAQERARLEEDNDKSLKQLTKFGEQREAAARHREAEAHAKHLEEKLLCARLAEVEAKLSDARQHAEVMDARASIVALRAAGQREQLALCQAKWDELQATLDKTAAAMSEYDEQAALASERAHELGQEQEQLAAKVGGYRSRREGVLANNEDLLIKARAEVEALEVARGEARLLQERVKKARLVPGYQEAAERRAAARAEEAAVAKAEAEAAAEEARREAAARAAEDARLSAACNAPETLVRCRLETLSESSLRFTVEFM